MKKTQQGFTLIELIIVIVILGILAVTASPKFLDLQGDAKASTVQGLSASLKSASNIVYSKALVQGVAGGATGSTTNPTINVVYGYPEATVANLQAILDISSEAAGSDNTAGVDWEISVGTNEAKIFPTGVYDESTPVIECYVQFNEATDKDTPATVIVKTSAC